MVDEIQSKDDSYELKRDNLVDAKIVNFSSLAIEGDSYIGDYIESAKKLISVKELKEDSKEIAQYLNLLKEAEFKVNSFRRALVIWQIFINVSLATGLRIKDRKLIKKLHETAFKYLEATKKISDIIKNLIKWNKDILENITYDFERYSFVLANSYSKSIWSLFKEKKVEDDLIKKLFSILNTIDLSDTNVKFLKITTDSMSVKSKQRLKEINNIYYYIHYITLFSKILDLPIEYDSLKEGYAQHVSSNLIKNNQEIERVWNDKIMPALNEEIENYNKEFDTYKNKVEEFISKIQTKKIEVLYKGGGGIFKENNKLLEEIIKKIKNWSQLKDTNIGENKELKELIVKNTELKIMHELNGYIGNKDIINIKFEGEEKLGLSTDKINKYYTDYLEQSSKKFKENLENKKNELIEVCSSIKKEKENIEKNAEFKGNLKQYLNDKVEDVLKPTLEQELLSILENYKELNENRWNNFVKELGIYMQSEKFEKWKKEYEDEYKKAYNELIKHSEKYNEIISKAGYLKSKVLNHDSDISKNINEQKVKDLHKSVWDSLKSNLRVILEKLNQDLEKITIDNIYNSYKNSNYQARSGALGEIRKLTARYEALSANVGGGKVLKNEVLKEIKSVVSYE